MGENGCQPIEAYTAYRNGSGSIDLDDCVESFSSLVKGGYMWGKDISDDKYCDSSKAKDFSYTNNMRSRIEGIARCFKMYPNLSEEYEKFHTPKSSTKEKTSKTSKS